MLEGFYGARKVSMGSHRGRLDPQAMLWSRSLRGTYDNNVKKLKEDMEAKRRDRVRKNGVLRDPPLVSVEELAPRSASQTPSCSQETPSESPRRPRPKSAEVRGAKKLLRILQLDHMLSDEEVECAVEPERASKIKKLKGKGKTKRNLQRRPSTGLSKKPRSKEEVASPLMRDVSPLTSWRMDPSLPEILRETLREKLSTKRDNVTMSSQKTVKEPVESDHESSEEEYEPPVTQWRYKPLPGELLKVTRKSIDAGDIKPKNVNRKSADSMPQFFDLDDLRILVVAMQKEHRRCIRGVAESLEHHTRQIVLLTKANSSLADHVENIEKEMKVLKAMQYVCTTIP